ncbi:MAG: hypothetical protein K0Q94_2861 [Paenibacillus sp.]|uniref:Uncharacterized protein n=1 Tax=Paenibacillus hemerocallicola TaxID=1172614 RepID=A0A5C4T7C2_9BACL|nr:hypothetical protein [Paenibacillus hemerocallicola]MDF2660070.1 hypothetical protein [Paenibacillus sp.]TNJ64277.1 hypothetical protein FE784_21025 [Paenibacillus hemerocallicola]
MNATISNPIAQAWINDYLDLYNYAVALGDSEWQLELINKLKQNGVHIERHLRENQREQLWKMFDSINRNMLEIYDELRDTKNVKKSEILKEQVWELKIRRLDISRKLKACGS